MRRLIKCVRYQWSSRDKSLSLPHSPLNFCGEVIELPEEHLAFTPTRQVIVAPVFDQFLQVIRIETILECHTLQWRCEAQCTIQLFLQILNRLQFETFSVKCV